MFFIIAWKVWGQGYSMHGHMWYMICIPESKGYTALVLPQSLESPDFSILVQS